MHGAIRQLRFTSWAGGDTLTGDERSGDAGRVQSRLPDRVETYEFLEGGAKLATAAAPTNPVIRLATNRWFQLVMGIFAMLAIANLQYAWTFFTTPLTKHYHVQLAVVQVAFSTFILAETWLVPVEGFLIDKIGPRIIMCIGGVLVGLISAAQGASTRSSGGPSGAWLQLHRNGRVRNFRTLPARPSPAPVARSRRRCRRRRPTPTISVCITFRVRDCPKTGSVR